jgi:hypothetical protein
MRWGAQLRLGMAKMAIDQGPATSRQICGARRVGRRENQRPVSVAGAQSFASQMLAGAVALGPDMNARLRSR